MSFALKGLLAGFWLLLVPTAAGVPFLRKKSPFSLAESFLAGYLFLFSAAELLTLPMIYLDQPLHRLTVCYGTVTLLTAAAGVILTVRDAPVSDTTEKRGSRLFTPGALRHISPFLIAAVIIILIQICAVIVFAHNDADDAFYVATAVTDVETDTIFSTNAYTGLPYRVPYRRYILSPFPVFLAVVSQLSAGLHPAIMAHTVFPAVFLFAVYVVLYQFARRWFPDDADARGIFLFLAAVLSWFSAYSVYNSGSFQMVRLWQCKAVLASFMLPLLIHLSFSITMEEHPRYSWLLFGMANLSGCLLSSMGIILTPLVMGLFVFAGLLRFRSFKRTALGLLCCLPSVLLGLFYVLVL